MTKLLLFRNEFCRVNYVKNASFDFSRLKIKQLSSTELLLPYLNGKTNDTPYANYFHVHLTQYRNPKSYPVTRCSTISTDVGSSLLFQAQFVKVWKFAIGPNEQCPLHQHIHPYVFINMGENETVGIDAKGNKCVEGGKKQHDKQVTFVNISKESGPRIHAVQNVGDTLFQQYILEFL